MALYVLFKNKNTLLFIYIFCLYLTCKCVRSINLHNVSVSDHLQMCQILTDPVYAAYLYQEKLMAHTFVDSQYFEG